MTTPATSSETVFYDLRPAKQVARRMIIDAFHRLAAAGFPVRDYLYVGFGSIYFVDFILFHRLLGLNRLLSLEADAGITRRVKFNQPFRNVCIEMKPAGDVMPALDRDLRHIVWLDYDYRLDRSVVSDVSQAAYQLATGSILLVTVDVKAPEDRSEPKEWKQYYEVHAGDYFDVAWADADFAASNLGKINATILWNAIRNGIAGRDEVRLSPLFSFLYADGHPMLTVGGVIASPSDERMIAGCDFSDAAFIRRAVGDEPYQIRVPRLTRKERLYLDKFMPCDAGWTPGDFELSEADVSDYRRVYRYYPTYAELLL